MVLHRQPGGLETCYFEMGFTVYLVIQFTLLNSIIYTVHFIYFNLHCLFYLSCLTCLFTLPTNLNLPVYLFRFSC